MCDALSRNKPKDVDVILINCLSHAMRKFDEIEHVYPDICSFVLKCFGKVYKIDAKARQLKLTAEDRLHYHQTHSASIMTRLKSTLESQLADRRAEPSSSLGGAIKYTLKHWGALTQFLKIPHALLDNNVIEAALKVPIRTRKNAMFFKTKHGAMVGSIILSIIQTCQAAKVNPVDYLTMLQVHKNQVFKEPSAYLPWNYQDQASYQTSNVA